MTELISYISVILPARLNQKYRLWILTLTLSVLLARWVGSNRFDKMVVDFAVVLYYLSVIRRCDVITLRLDQDLEQQLNNTAKNLGLTKSELIRKSIREYLRKLKQPNAWTIGEDLFGNYSSGKSNLSSDRKELLENIIKAKRV